jgi:ArsR family transcriptional regulator
MKKVADPDVVLFQALGEETRLAIVRHLAREGEVSACDFTACCDVAQPTISHHLKVLREAGVVSSDRRGTSIAYRLRPEATRRLAGLLSSLTRSPDAAPARAASDPGVSKSAL